MWGYRQVYTIAQIELMTCDVPIIVYEKIKKDGKKKHSKKEMDELTRKWNELKAKNSDGIKFDLNDFLRTGNINKD